MLWWKRQSFWPDILFGIFIFYCLVKKIKLGKLVLGISPFIWIFLLVIVEIFSFIYYKKNHHS